MYETILMGMIPKGKIKFVDWVRTQPDRSTVAFEETIGDDDASASSQSASPDG
jgi:hypothetical protein